MTRPPNTGSTTMGPDNERTRRSANCPGAGHHEGTVMTAPTISRPAAPVHMPDPVTIAEVGRHETSHLVCGHSPSYQRALCGADVAGEHICPDDYSCGCTPCDRCDHIAWNLDLCTVTGETCTCCDGPI